MQIAINTLATPSKKIGAGEYLNNLITQLQMIDQENMYYIFTARETRHLFPLENQNFKEICVNIPQGIRGVSPVARTLWLHTGFLKSCRYLDTDIIHVPNTQLILWKRPATVVSIFDLGEWHMRRSHLIRTAYRKIANYAQARLSHSIITISESSRDDICRFLKVPDEKVTITYPGVSDRFLKKIQQSEARTMIRDTYGIREAFILSVASQIKQKNITGILEAIARIRHWQNFTRKLVLVGKPGNVSSEIQRAVSRLNLEKDVVFTGYVPDEHLPYFYAAAKMFVFPSLWEGFGIPVVEAMACGCPVICSDVASLPEVAGNAAVLVNPVNISEIAGAILEIEQNPEIENRLKIAGPVQARKFSYRLMAEKTLEVYEKTYTAYK